MIYTLKNEFLAVQVADKGAELRSVVGADGTEYMWQADARYWGKTAPWMFPVCGRLQSDAYIFGGQRYKMGRHGFARDSVFAVTDAASDRLTMVLAATDETKKMYPFAFILKIDYCLEKNSLVCTISIINEGTDVMPLSFGGHPGFCVPVGGVGAYADCYLEFSAPCTPKQVVFDENLLDSGKRRPFPLQEGRYIPLSHQTFENDAIFLCNVADEVTLRSKKTARAVTLSSGGAPYLGIWSTYPEGDFVCIEPWFGMVAPAGVTELDKMPTMMHVAAGECRRVQLKFSFC